MAEVTNKREKMPHMEAVKKVRCPKTARNDLLLEKNVLLVKFKIRPDSRKYK